MRGSERKEEGANGQESEGMEGDGEQREQDASRKESTKASKKRGEGKRDTRVVLWYGIQRIIPCTSSLPLGLPPPALSFSLPLTPLLVSIPCVEKQKYGMCICLRMYVETCSCRENHAELACLALGCVERNDVITCEHAE